MLNAHDSYILDQATRFSEYVARELGRYPGEKIWPFTITVPFDDDGIVPFESGTAKPIEKSLTATYDPRTWDTYLGAQNAKGNSIPIPGEPLGEACDEIAARLVVAAIHKNDKKVDLLKWLTSKKLLL